MIFLPKNSKGFSKLRWRKYEASQYVPTKKDTKNNPRATAVVPTIDDTSSWCGNISHNITARYNATAMRRSDSIPHFMETPRNTASNVSSVAKSRSMLRKLVSIGGEFYCGRFFLSRSVIRIICE